MSNLLGSTCPNRLQRLIQIMTIITYLAICGLSWVSPISLPFHEHTLSDPYLQESGVESGIDTNFQEEIPLSTNGSTNWYVPSSPLLRPQNNRIYTTGNRIHLMPECARDFMIVTGPTPLLTMGSHGNTDEPENHVNDEDDPHMGSRPPVPDFAARLVRFSGTRRLQAASRIVNVLRALHIRSYEELASLSYETLTATTALYSENDAEETRRFLGNYVWPFLHPDSAKASGPLVSGCIAPRGLITLVRCTLLEKKS